MPSATSSSWNLTHPSKGCWNEIQKAYYTTQTDGNWQNISLIPPIVWMTPLQSMISWFSGRKLALLMVVCSPEAPKNKRSSRTWLPHPSSPHLRLGRKFFEKIGNIFLQHLVALSSCNTRFKGETWELSQLEYSGEMQLLQKDFDMKKAYVDALWASKTYTEHRQYTSHHDRSRVYHFWEISIIKHIWAIFRLVINHKHSGSQNSLFGQAKHTENTENLSAIMTDPEFTIYENFQSWNISELYLDM